MKKGKDERFVEILIVRLVLELPDNEYRVAGFEELCQPLALGPA